MGCAKANFFGPAPWGPEEGSKGHHLISITKSISKILIPNFLCVLKNERYKTYQMGYTFCHLCHAPGMGLWCAGGAQGVEKKNSIMIMWHIKSTGVFEQGAEQNRMQVQFSSEGQTGDLVVRSKGQISLNFGDTVKFWDFIPNVVCVLTNKT